MPAAKKPKPIVGWRELLDLPDLCSTPIKVKIDTGARTSALHAFGLRVSDQAGIPHARFEVHPQQRSKADAVSVSLPIHAFRKVKSSNGKTEVRPVIITTARLGRVEWPIEVTLTSRDEMGFRMLLGRAAVRNHFLVNPGRSYLQSRRPSRKSKRQP